MIIQEFYLCDVEKYSFKKRSGPEYNDNTSYKGEFILCKTKPEVKLLSETNILPI